MKTSNLSSSSVNLKPLIIRDEIHGDISFDAILRQVIDHPNFQRLRYIKQLGLAEYVFPCATHTRFQHSIGACFLAGQYFETMLRGWVISPFKFNGTSHETEIFSDQTRKTLEQIALDRNSRKFWWRTASLSGLLHDIGHGPWSHTFEYLELPQDFSGLISSIKGGVGEYFSQLKKKNRRLMHEDLSVLYIFETLRELKLEKPFFLPIALLVNQKMAQGELKKQLQLELVKSLASLGIKGGIEVHHLLRPIISGPFDVDRMDYIQRDGRNCGVHIGGIEWRRIVSKLIPCLAKHPSRSRNEPSEVVLISNIKNQHILDDFIFSLFQMYAQVYLHPKIVGIEEITRQLLAKRIGKRKKPVIDFDLHRSLTDEKFRDLLRDTFKTPEIEDILLRDPDAQVSVASSAPGDQEMDRELKRNGYTFIDTLDRPMMKDSAGVFLFSSFKLQNPSGKSSRYFIQPWERVSPIAKQFYEINYSPKLWVRSKLLGKL